MIKPFLGIDLTNNKHNICANGEEFLTVQPSAAMAQILEDSTKKAEAVEARAKLPLALRVIQWTCGAVGAVIFLSFVKAHSGSNSTTLAEGYQNAAWLYWLAGATLAIWGILKLAGMKKAKGLEGESVHSASQLQSAQKAVFSEMNIPADARNVDLLSFLYKDKGDKLKVCEKGMATHFNNVFQLFSDEEHLYLANLTGKYTFPRSALRTIRPVKKHIRLSNWNKSEAYNDGIYGQYKMTIDQYGHIHIWQYYILELEHSGETWGIYFPAYELPAFEHFTGMRAEAK